MKRTAWLIAITMGVMSICADAADLADLSNLAAVGDVIGWVPQKNTVNLCHGYYRELPIPYEPNPLLTAQTDNYDIHADTSDVSLKGTSTLTGNVRIAQPTQVLKAQKAVIYRDATGKINHIELYDKVRYYTPGQMLAGTHATAYLNRNYVRVQHAAYRTSLNSKLTKTVARTDEPGSEKHIYDLNFWGTANTITQTKPKFYLLKDATYTTCSPGCDAWKIHATTVTLDKVRNRGSAWNSVLYWKGKPVFYWPYLNFALRKTRKTGFLSPHYSHSTISGYSLLVPFYWNMAPNYDALLSAQYYSLRGVMAAAKFRFLTQKSRGAIDGTFLPNDRAFASFQKSAQTNPTYANRPESLRTLANDSDNRYALHVQDDTKFNTHLTGFVDVSHYSDDYYAQDFNGLYMANSLPNQLLEAGGATYQTEHWSFYGLLQAYQNLHPVNEATVINQYNRLPEVQVNGNYPSAWHNFSLGMSAQNVYFDQAKTPDVSTLPVNGNRLSVTPYISYPIVRPYGYLTPKLQFRAMDYQLTQIRNLPSKYPNLTMPIFDVHGGLLFERPFSLWSHAFEQTLEPELYYLYVPYRNQDDLPIFDTYNQQFTYQEMFEDNRFSGMDRIGDANQLTLAVTSRLIDEQTGATRASLSVGEIAYFANRRVLLCNNNQGGNCQQVPVENTRPFSPLTGQATFTIANGWSGNLQGTWSSYAHNMDSAGGGVHYQQDGHHLFNVNYTFIANGNPDLQGLNNLSVSSYWRIVRRWDVIGALTHQWGAASGNLFLAGLGYQSCCWGTRLVVARSFNRLDNAGNVKYNTGVYLEFVLKGLGGYSTSGDMQQLLASYVSGYRDDFTEVE